jgi:phage terminase large subunit
VRTEQVELPPKLIPVFLGAADYRGAFGGRGSAKTRSFAKMTAVRGYQWSQAGEEGLIVGGREFMNSLDESSMAEIKAAILSEPWLADHYDIGERYIRTRDRRIEYDFIGLRHNLDSIKSKARIKLLWVDEAEPVTETAWEKAIPSVREEDAEIWVTWNPERKASATHKRFRESAPPRSKIVELNWRDNPWFPGILERVRQDDLEKRPESYDHIWEGAFKTYFVGAYFTRELVEAKGKGRIGNVSADPLMTYRAFWDIGGAGAKADSTAIWIAQFIGTNIHVLDYYEAQGQPLATHVNWLRANGYGNALCVLPHDGAHTEKVFDASYEGSLRQAGFEVKVVPNQGRGAAMARVESIRRQFPRIWFNDATTTAGRDALAAYHEKRDEERNIGLGPNHDWSSHGADAFGLMCVAYEAPKVERPKPTRQHHGGAGAWMG